MDEYQRRFFILSHESQTLSYYINCGVSPVCAQYPFACRVLYVFHVIALKGLAISRYVIALKGLAISRYVIALKGLAISRYVMALKGLAMGR